VVVAEEVTTKSRNTGKTKRQGEPAMHSGTRKRPAFLCQGEPEDGKTTLLVQLHVSEVLS
jgi:hypothetical protein